MRKIEVVLSDERLITPSGLCMVGQAMAKSDLTDATANLERNPHSWHHSEYTCSDCHKSHRASVMVCTQCHDDAQVPTGWLSYDESTQLQNQYISYDLEGQVYAD